MFLNSTPILSIHREDPRYICSEGDGMVTEEQDRDLRNKVTPLRLC